METLPLLGGIHESQSGLILALSSLFEPSPILITKLEPELRQKLQSTTLSSYAQLIDLAISHVLTWDKSLQAQFISGHPRIGETKNLSTFSAKEQGAVPAAASTPPEVLARLAHLNAYYERRYPDLVYIIFVNGRSRAEVVCILEDHLRLAHSLSSDQPSVDTAVPVEIGSEEWTLELQRAIQDVRYIAKSRLEAMGIE